MPVREDIGEECDRDREIEDSLLLVVPRDKPPGSDNDEQKASDEGPCSTNVSGSLFIKINLNETFTGSLAAWSESTSSKSSILAKRKADAIRFPGNDSTPILRSRTFVL